MIPWPNVVAVMVVILITGGLYYSWVRRPRRGLAIAEEQLRLWTAQVKLLEDNQKAVERQNDILERIAAALEDKTRPPTN